MKIDIIPLLILFTIVVLIIKSIVDLYRMKSSSNKFKANWLFVICAFPLVGSLLFYLFGINSGNNYKKKNFSLRRTTDKYPLD
ncbi:PLDc N-terminal domain-containing protein [Belliella aquatica]|uniref:Cardiolipin synthase N-terminal domain-containing protein n=1 Tax=Belliella aquatica TaxID=1323734 RepID=A0ABQ1M423_9BACT|nr:hypothetical protein GCM10010993_09220 [Belliella aquatica]